MRVVNFTKNRYLTFALSVVLIVAGIGVTIARGGFNLGIDFNAGLNQRVQVAPVAASVSYSGEANALIEVTGTSVVVNLIEAGQAKEVVFDFEANPTLGDIKIALSTIPGMSLQARVSETTPAVDLVGFSYAVDLSEGVALVNYVDGSGDVVIDDLRTALAPLGEPQIQVVGDEVDQEFIIRIQDNGDVADFADVTAKEIVSLLGDVFGDDKIIVNQTDYVGARFSNELGSQTFTLSILALILILVYIWIRFQLASAVSAITALIHDVLIMIGFIGAFQMEVVTATIAAVLTIIGYSLNDTIVVFDRIRENQRLMRDNEFSSIINTSITQSLSRTIITSLTTLLAVVSLFIFGTGPIKDFALAMIVGVIVGTYSSIFVASPVLLGWTNVAKKRKQTKDNEKYGLKTVSEVKDDSAEPSDTTDSLDIPSVERKLKGKRKKK